MNPTCPACGTAVRWIAAANGWGCDRCRQMVAMPAPEEMSPRSRIWLLALIAILIAGGISLVVAFR